MYYVIQFYVLLHYNITLFQYIISNIDKEVTREICSVKESCILIGAYAESVNLIMPFTAIIVNQNLVLF